jgi:uncharacterized protein
MPSKSDAFPSVREAAALLLGLFLLEYLIGAALYDARHVLGITTHQQQALNMLLANGIVVVLVMQIRSMNYRDLFQPSQSSPVATLLLLVPPVLLLVPGILLVDETIDGVLQKLLPLSQWEEQAFESMVANNLAAVISTCVLAPVLEEALFRGILLRSFLAQHDRWPAIAFSALFFGAMHMNVYQFVLAFWLGLLLGWLFARSHSLIPCIALHGAVNSWVVFTEIGRKANLGQESSGHGPWVWLSALVCAAVGALVLRRLLIQKGSEPPKNAA